MSLRENGPDGLNGGGADGDAQVDPPQDGGGDGPNNGADRQPSETETPPVTRCNASGTAVTRPQPAGLPLMQAGSDR